MARPLDWDVLKDVHGKFGADYPYNACSFIVNIDGGTIELELFLSTRSFK